MKHFLAYGNSDQQSFRSPVVRPTFDIMTVPSTIAAYYPEATAGFVLSAQLDYIIEPRTPLFQGQITKPRASHYELANILGPAMVRQIGTDGPAYFPAEFYTDSVCDEIVQSFVQFQTTYSDRGDDIRVKLDRYADLLSQATGAQSRPAASTTARAPVYVLCPYLAIRTLNDPWWEKNQSMWDSAIQMPNREAVSPVLAVQNIQHLDNALTQVPRQMADTVFYWVTDYDERKVSQENLMAMRQTIQSHSQTKRLINLYGGFFSICLGKDGLYGFNNGLGYSEYRAWPTLAATGAAPARYYLPELHAFLTPERAQRLLEVDEFFKCDCGECDGRINAPGTLDYQGLKRHFALARQKELVLCASESKFAIAARLEEAYRHALRAQAALPQRMSFPYAHLRRWGDVLKG